MTTTEVAFRGRILEVMALKIRQAEPDDAPALAAEMFALIERHGWRFVTRAELEAQPTVTKTVTFQKDRAGNTIGAVIHEQ